MGTMRSPKARYRPVVRSPQASGDASARPCQGQGIKASAATSSRTAKWHSILAVYHAKWICSLYPWWTSRNVTDHASAPVPIEEITSEDLGREPVVRRLSGTVSYREE